MSDMKYNLYNLGPTDLLLGPERLRELMARSGFPWLSSNLVDGRGGTFAGRTAVLEVQGVKVGFFGLLSPEAPLAGFGRPGEYAILEPRRTAVELVGRLRGEGCRLVVLLSGLGLSEDMKLARDTDGIDVIFSGLTRTLTLKPDKVGDTVIVQAGSKGMYIGDLSLEMEPPGGPPAEAPAWLTRLSGCSTPTSWCRASCRHRRRPGGSSTRFSAGD